MIIDLALKAVKRTFYALMSFPLGLTWFVLFVTLLSTAFGLLFIGIGVVLFWLTLLIAGGCAAFERSLMSAFLDLEVPEPERRQDGRRPVGSFLLTLRDVSYWRELAFLIARFPLGLAMFVVTVTGWSIAFSGLTSIIWVWPSQPEVFASPLMDIIVFTVTGAAAVVITPIVLFALIEFQNLVAMALLGPTHRELVQRTRTVVESRARSVEAAETERRRIERDLHDGAQARLATIALDLGRAKRRLEQGAPADELGPIIDSAHDDAKTALVELRNLARGIHPAVLTDRGLDAALSDVAARCPIPIHLDVRTVPRLPPHLESVAYFVVNELVQNITRHSQARNAWVIGRRDDREFVLEVIDDGVGGIDPALGTGLRGLQDRVRAVDGELSVRSPLGEGSSIRVEIPIGAV